MPENSLKSLCWYRYKSEKQARFGAVFERLTTFDLASGRPALLQRPIPHRQNKGRPGSIPGRPQRQRKTRPKWPGAVLFADFQQFTEDSNGQDQTTKDNEHGLKPPFLLVGFAVSLGFWAENRLFDRGCYGFNYTAKGEENQS